MANLKDELKQRLPERLFALLEDRQGPARLRRELQAAFPVSASHAGDGRRAWGLTGLHYSQDGRPAEARILLRDVRSGPSVSGRGRHLSLQGYASRLDW